MVTLFDETAAYDQRKVRVSLGRQVARTEKVGRVRASTIDWPG
jgi:hypothetical protein